MRNYLKIDILAMISASSRVSGRFLPRVSGRSNDVMAARSDPNPKMISGNGVQYSDNNRTIGVRIALTRAVVVASPTPIALHNNKKHSQDTIEFPKFRNENRSLWYIYPDLTMLTHDGNLSV